MPEAGTSNIDGIQTFIGINLHKDSLTWYARNASSEEVGAGKIPTRRRNKILGFTDD